MSDTPQATSLPTGDRLYFRQLLSGQDFATSDPIARQMVNFAYLIGDRETREAVVVDPAYAVDDLLDILEADDMRLTGVLATHFHADHVGGNMMGYSIEGVAALLERQGTKIHLQAPEAELVRKTTGISGSDMELHAPGDIVSVGAIDIELLHTPGHTTAADAWTCRVATLRRCTARCTTRCPRCPTTRCCFPGTGTRSSPAPQWATHAR